MAKRFLGGVALCATLLTPVLADPPTATVIGTPPQPTWNLLTIEQRTILSPLGNEWDKMENFRRKKWLGIADRYSKLTPDEQHRIQDRMREWATMTPEQRAKVRDSYKEFKQLPAEKKQAVKEKWETYSKLPEEEKARIKQSKAAAKAVAPTDALAQPVPTPPQEQPSAQTTPNISAAPPSPTEPAKP